MPDPVKDACQANFAAHANDCSGFARAVAGQLGVTLNGLANQIVDTIRGGAGWTLLANGVAAEQAAAAGKFHVVVVVAGRPLNRDKYPFAYWGRLGGGGKENETVNFAWRAEDRDNVTYAAHDIAPRVA